MYAAYVGLVAVANLLIGFKLAMLFGHRPAAAHSLPDLDEDIASDTAVDNVTVTSKTTEDSDSRQASPVAEAASERNSTPVGGTWSEIATILVDQATSFESTVLSLQSRADAGPEAVTPEEAAAIKQQAVDATSQWLATVETISEQLRTSLKAVRDDKNIGSQCDRIVTDHLAQVETSLSNLTMMDLTGDRDASLTHFSQELQRLLESCAKMRDKFQKLVSFAYAS